VAREDARGGRLFRVGDPDQEMLGRDVFVLEVVGRLECGVEDLPQRAADPRLGGRTADLRILGDLSRNLGLDGRRIQSELVQDRSDDAPLLLKQGEQQMFRRQLGVPCPPRQVLRLSHRLLCLDRKLVEIHGVTSH